VRFLLVYAGGSVLYWIAAVVVRRVGASLGLSSLLAENAGIIAGGGVMMVTSYLGHRFFTYRTHRGVGAGLGAG
jgi:hypothetical protein